MLVKKIVIGFNVVLKCKKTFRKFQLLSLPIVNVNTQELV